jgi:uncharacterized glyoxalase superfamily protein PhnB
MTATLESISPVLPARELLETVRWYEQNLGFRCLFVYPKEAPDYAAVARGGVEIHFFPAKVDPKKNDWMCYLRVRGIEALYEEYRAKGLIHPNAPLATKPWGQREFAVGDLNGTLLTFGEPASDKAS